jgi:hypothetical protein
MSRAAETQVGWETPNLRIRRGVELQVGAGAASPACRRCLSSRPGGAHRQDWIRQRPKSRGL